MLGKGISRHIIEAESKEEACEKFMDYYFEDLFPECKEFRKKRKKKCK